MPNIIGVQWSHLIHPKLSQIKMLVINSYSTRIAIIYLKMGINVWFQNLEWNKKRVRSDLIGKY